jgi:hypothetical protein
MNTLFEFSKDLSEDQKLDTLFKHFGLTESVVIDEDDKPMLVLALNQDDVVTVIVEQDGALLVEYKDGLEDE